jgi:hypothetical protein
MFFTLSEYRMRCASYKRVSFIRPVCAGITACLIITHSDEVWQGGAESLGAARTGVVFSMYFSATAPISFRVLADTVLLNTGLLTERHNLSRTDTSGGVALTTAEIIERIVWRSPIGCSCS